MIVATVRAVVEEGPMAAGGGTGVAGAAARAVIADLAAAEAVAAIAGDTASNCSSSCLTSRREVSAAFAFSAVGKLIIV